MKTEVMKIDDRRLGFNAMQIAKTSKIDQVGNQIWEAFPNYFIKNGSFDGQVGATGLEVLGNKTFRTPEHCLKFFHMPLWFMFIEDRLNKVLLIKVLINADHDAFFRKVKT